MQIGEPLRTIVVEPLELPVSDPQTQPEPSASGARRVTYCSTGGRFAHGCEPNAQPRGFGRKEAHLAEAQRQAGVGSWESERRERPPGLVRAAGAPASLAGRGPAAESWRRC